jgi:hypothetical protein
MKGMSRHSSSWKTANSARLYVFNALIQDDIFFLDVLWDHKMFSASILRAPTGGYRWYRNRFTAKLAGIQWLESKHFEFNDEEINFLYNEAIKRSDLETVLYLESHYHPRPDSDLLVPIFGRYVPTNISNASTLFHHHFERPQSTDIFIIFLQIHLHTYFLSGNGGPLLLFGQTDHT